MHMAGYDRNTCTLPLPVLEICLGQAGSSCGRQKKVEQYPADHVPQKSHPAQVPGLPRLPTITRRILAFGGLGLAAVRHNLRCCSGRQEFNSAARRSALPFGLGHVMCSGAAGGSRRNVALLAARERPKAQAPRCNLSEHLVEWRFIHQSIALCRCDGCCGATRKGACLRW